jgi:hypothetical protein
MRFHEINDTLDIGPRTTWPATLTVPVRQEDWEKWKEVIKAYGVDIVLRLDRMTSDPATQLLTVACPSRKVARALDEAWSNVVRGKSQ